MKATAEQATIVGSVDGLYDEKICGWALTLGALQKSTALDIGFAGGVTRQFATHYCRADVSDLGYPADNLAGFAFPLASLTQPEARRILLATEGDNLSIMVRAGDAVLSGSPCQLSRQVLFALVRPEAPVGELLGTVDDISHAGVRGWCFEKGGQSGLLVALRVDGRVVGVQRADGRRPDVAMHWGESYAECGFDIPIPAALFDNGQHSVVVEDVLHRRALSPPRAFSFPMPGHIATRPDLIEELRRFLAQGTALLQRFERESHSSAAEIASWDYVFRTWHRTAAPVLQRQRLLQGAFSYRPLISVLLPAYNTVKWMLADAIESVLAQTYDHWELIIADDASPDDAISDIAQQYQAADPGRIRLLRAGVNGGIAANTNRALAEARGEYIAFFDHDDLLEPDALYAMVEALQLQRFRLIYTDEDSVTASHVFCHPHFKPAWDPVLLCGLNYICHFVLVQAALISEAGPLDPQYDGAQDKEFLLRLSDHVAESEVLHIPRVLYHWRHHAASFSKTDRRRAALLECTQQVTLAWAQSRFGAARAELVEPPELYAVHLNAGLAGESPLVSVIIPTRDRADLVADCTASLLQGSYRNLEILIVDHESGEKMTAALFRILGTVSNTRVIRYQGAFNWSAISNHGAARARGEYLLFLNNDTVMITPDAIEQMVAFARLADAGAVGARLLYGDGRTQHVGVQLGASGIAAHGFVGHAREELVYFGYPKLTRSVAAVTGACLLVRRDLFDAVGGFDVGQLGVALSDIDFCLKLLLLGRRNIVVTTAEFFHYESVSRGSDETPGNRERFAAESAAFQKRWDKLIDADPFYNPNFELRGAPYRRLHVGTPPDYLFRLKARQALDALRVSRAGEVGAGAA